MRLRSIALCISLPLALGALLGRVTPSAAPQEAKTASLDAQALSKQLAASVARGDTPDTAIVTVYPVLDGIVNYRSGIRYTIQF